MEANLIGLISVIVITIGGWGTTILNGYFEKKKSRKEMNKRDKILAESLRGFENNLVEIGMKLDDFKKENDFDKTLRNNIRNKASQVVNLNYNLEKVYKNIIIYISVQVEDIALQFYYSIYRHKPREMEKFIVANIDGKIALIKTFINENVPDFRYYKINGDNKRILFTDFLQKINIEKHVELLKLTLSRNGLTKERIISEFTNFIEKISENFIKAVIIWHNLDTDDKKST